MKNETLRNYQNYLRTIKMMLKQNVLLDVDIYTLRRNVDRLVQLNNNKFSSLTQYYEIILNHSEYNELDKDMGEYTKYPDLFWVKIEELLKNMDLFRGEIIEETQPMYESYL